MSKRSFDRELLDWELDHFREWGLEALSGPLDDAQSRTLREAFAAIVQEIEAMPYEVGKAVDEAVSIFTFSIGAGAAGTCQLLNGYDLIGGFDTFKPKFAKRYGNVAEVATQAFAAFAGDVRAGTFPDAEHSYTMKPEEAAKLAQALAGRGDES